MLTRLSLNNYRAWEKLDIPLAKINLFLGPNNSGKSTILSAINLLSQTLDSADREVPLLLKGKFEDLGSYWDVVYDNDIGRNMSFGIEFPFISSRTDKGQQNGRLDITFHYRKQRRQIVVESLQLASPPGHIFLGTRIAKTSDNQLIDYFDKGFTGIKTGPSSSGMINLLHFIPYLAIPYNPRTYLKKIRSPKYAGFQNIDIGLYDFRRSLVEHLGHVEFIGPFRRAPERTYTFSGETPSNVGVHGEKAIDMIAADQSRRHGKSLNLTHKISQWLQRAEIAKGIEIDVVTDRYFEVRVTHFDTGENETLADVGYGCSQILPILVAGYHLPSSRTLIVGEPEIHLHPKAAAEVGTFLYEVAKRDIQLFVETHSEHLLLRLQSHVASGKLSPDDVNVFYVYSDRKGRKKICHRIPLGKDGFFAEKWPKGFFPETLEEAKRIAKFSVI